MTYQDDPLLKIRKFADRDPDKKYDKVLVLVDARDLVPIEWNEKERSEVGEDIHIKSYVYSKIEKAYIDALSLTTSP